MPELHAIIEFSNVTKREANKLEAALKQCASDAQLHNKWFYDPKRENDYNKGRVALPHRVSVFIEAPEMKLVREQLDAIKRRMDARPGAEYAIVAEYMFEEGKYVSAYETAR